MMAAVMNLAIALAQFIMLALGVMASRILLSCGAIPPGSRAWTDRIPVFVATNGIWLLLIPAVWLLFSSWCTQKQNRWAKGTQGVGMAIAVWILVLIVVVLVF